MTAPQPADERYWTEDGNEVVPVEIYVVPVETYDALRAALAQAERERDEALAANERARQFSYASHRRRAEAAERKAERLAEAVRAWVEAREAYMADDDDDPFSDSALTFKAAEEALIAALDGGQAADAPEPAREDTT